MLGFSDYNYEHFTREHLHDTGRTAFTGPEPGEHAPDFKGRTLDGETIRLSDYQGKKNVVLIFGSATCPMTAGSIHGINELYDEFRGDDIDFLFVYAREAHPGEKIPAHESMADKVRAARLLRDQEDLSMPLSYGVLYSYRALERGGTESLKDFREALGFSGTVAVTTSRAARSILENPKRVLAVAALTAAVLTGGLYAGFELRKRRLGLTRNPYKAYEKEEVKDTETGTDYGAVGI